MGAKAFLIHPPHQGVCGRHGTEDLCVTPVELMRSPSGIGVTGLYKPRGEVSPDVARAVGPPSSTSTAVKAVGPSDRQPSGLGKAAGEESRQRSRSQKSKVGSEEKFHA